MATRKLYDVRGLAGGDEGKGGAVHKVCDYTHAHTVLKMGGAQGSHGVRTFAGQNFAFSQFGCGTFGGFNTHLSELMLMDPMALLVEGETLVHKWRIANAFETITVDEGALCITPFHAIASQLKELARKGDPKGTVGIGSGPTILDAETHPELAIRARDLGRPDLRDMLEAVRLQKLRELEAVISDPDSFWEADRAIAAQLIANLRNEHFAAVTANEFNRMQRLVRIVDREYLVREVLGRDGTVVVESSHGILTDRYHGFHPHTTKLRTVPQGLHMLLEECGYDGDIFRIGVTRAYQVRHGAGPMVTKSDEMFAKMLPGSTKGTNRWQGTIRVGPVDFVALRYAIAVCGGPEAFDGIAVTWADQTQANGVWQTCDQYIGANDPELFDASGEILVRRGTDDAQLAHQERLGHALNALSFETTNHELTDTGDRDALTDLIADTLEERLDVPVCMMSFGPTERDKIVF